MKKANRQLDLSVIESYLHSQLIGRPKDAKNELWEEIDSTNSRALLLAQQGASAGVMVLAHSQSQGRGRLGHTWVSPIEAGLYLSILLRPENLTGSLPLVTIAAGLAVAMAVEITTGVKLQLKWVNDLVFEGRKVGGILAELQTAPQTSLGFRQALVIGIGINIAFENATFPKELSDKISWLESITHQPVDRNLLVAQIAYELEQALDLLARGQLSPILNSWRSYSATLGERVRATVGENTVEGIAVDITDSGALLVKTSSGTHELHAGEVSIRRIDGSYC